MKKAPILAKKLLEKAKNLHHIHHLLKLKGCLTSEDVDFQIALHYGIPSTASSLAFDPIQRLLAIGTLDGRIKVIGGDNIEGLLISPQKSAYKYLEFLSNKGFLVSISNDNDIQVWHLENRSIACSFQWKSNITAFSIIPGSHFMYVGDEYGLVSVLKHEAVDGELLLFPYNLPANSLNDAAGASFSDHRTVFGVLPQPCSSGNRLLIAYEGGLIILWDVVEGQVIVVRGDSALELKDGAVDYTSQFKDSASGQHLEEREITALCWASSNGSILAVGYIDGDILFWKTSINASSKGRHAGVPSNDVVKLQLSSAKKRLPVIVLHWSANRKSKHDGDGRLFIYGGDEIGSDEVLTVLSLEWHPEMENLRCVGRADLKLTGSFADMILLPSVINSRKTELVVLTSPGHLQFFSDDALSSLESQQEKKFTLSSPEWPVVVPTYHPVMTAAKLSSLTLGGNASRSLLELARGTKHDLAPKLAGGNWPITGGIVNQASLSSDRKIEKIYLAGYIDGSVRVWDASSPVLLLLGVIAGELKNVEVTGWNASVSVLDFCSLTSVLAIGNQIGLIRVYNLGCSLKEMSCHVVTMTEHEAHKLPEGGAINCTATFHLLDSPVQQLQYINCGEKLAVAYECGRVAVLDMNLFSISFLTDCLYRPSSPVISMSWNSFVHDDGHIKSPKQMETKNCDKPAEELLFVLTKEAAVYVVDSSNGNMISSNAMHRRKETTAISIYVIEGSASVLELLSQRKSQQSVKDAADGNDLSGDVTPSELIQHKIEEHSSPIHEHSGRSSKNSFVLLCYKDALRLYHLKSVVQGDDKYICKAKLAKSCCWTAIFKKDEKTCGLVLLFETGEVEVRSLPDLRLVKETSLMSILRWNFKASMGRTMSSTDDGQIALANGYEVAFISLLTSVNNFRIPESLPSLHDEVLAAAADPAISSSSNQKKKQGAPGIISNIVKGFKSGKVNDDNDVSLDSESSLTHLDRVFLKIPFPDPSPTTNTHETELDIDDIEIDDSEPLASTSQHEQINETGKKTEREKLFDGDDADVTPRLRTREEIIATYRRTKDASSVAGQARDKLLERQQKLEKISRRTEDLQNGAEDFASLANELVKQMERRKWWQI